MFQPKPKYPFSFQPEEGYYVRNLRKLVNYIDCNYQKEISGRFAADMIGLAFSIFFLLLTKA